MFTRSTAIVSLLAVGLLFGATVPVTADEAADKAFDSLATYEWGADRAALAAIDTAVAASHDDAAAKKALSGRLVAVLESDSPQAAKDFACRKLSLVAEADAVPTLAALLTDEKLSHMARYALERMPCPEAVKAMRDAVARTEGRLKVGMINSLGVRRDAEATGALIALLDDSDKDVAGAAAAALGEIGTPETAKALGAFQAKAPEALKLQAADAYLACAEKLVAAGKKIDAMMIYKSLAKPDQPKHVRLAATRGLLAAAAKK